MSTKTYELRHHANKQKEATIVESVKRQQEVLLDTTVQLTDFFFKNGFIPRFAPKGSGWREINAHNQVRGTFNAWLAVLMGEVRRLIAYLAPENEELRHELYAINKAKAWLRSDFKMRDGSEYSVEAWSVIRVVFDLAVEKHPVPTVGFQPTVLLGQHPQGVSVNESRKAIKFTRWLNLRSNIPYHPIQIPIFDDPYYKNAPGKENSTWVFQVKNGDELHIYATKTDVTAPEPKRESDNPLGLDWGFKRLFATSDGRLFGDATAHIPGEAR